MHSQRGQKGAEMNMSEKIIEKLGCDVIKDLIPSYLEHICSEGSKKVVEEHLLECEDCRRHVESLKQTTIVGRQVDLKAADYMKKTRHYYDKKTIACLIGVLAAVYVGFCCIAAPSFYIGGRYLEIAAAVIALSLLLLLQEGQEYREHKTSRKIAAALTIVGFAYLTGLYASFVCSWFYTQKTPFGIPEHQFGPFMHKQMVVVTILETGLFLWSLWDAMQKDHRLGLTSVIALLSMAYGMVLDETLYRLDDAIVLAGLYREMLIIFILEGIVLGGLTVILSKPLPDRR